MAWNFMHTGSIHITTRNNGYHYLSFDEAREDDIGTYEVHATNENGTVTSSFHLMVDTGVSNYCCPKFSSPIQVERLEPHQRILLRTKISAAPTVSVAW
jgi:hypothetical protein